jgi:3-hydroxybutyrate dehydrogenase
LVLPSPARSDGANVMINGMGRGDRSRAGGHGEGIRRHGDLFGRLHDEARRRSSARLMFVNNAGVQHVAPVEEFPRENLDMIIAINLSAAFHAMAAAIWRRCPRPLSVGKP